MKAYTRISDDEIKSYAPVVSPDMVLVIDPTLVGKIDVTEGMTERGILIVNTKESPEELKGKVKFSGAVHTVDASSISMSALGMNKPNMPILGALIKVTNIVSMEAVEALIKKKFTAKIGEQKTQANIDAIRRSYNEVM